MTRQARLPASAKLLPDERTSLPSPHTLYLGQRPTHISSALNATELSTHSDPTLLVLLPFACVQQFPGAVSHFTEAPAPWIGRLAPVSAVSIRAPNSTSQLERRALDLRRRFRCQFPWNVVPWECRPLGMSSFGIAILRHGHHLRHSASAEVFGVLEDCGLIRPLASKRHWQREAKAQTLREREKLVREGLRLRAIPPRLTVGVLSARYVRSHTSDHICQMWQPPSPPRNSRHHGFRRPTRQEPKLHEIAARGEVVPGARWWIL